MQVDSCLPRRRPWEGGRTPISAHPPFFGFMVCEPGVASNYRLRARCRKQSLMIALSKSAGRRWWDSICRLMLVDVQFSFTNLRKRSLTMGSIVSAHIPGTQVHMRCRSDAQPACGPASALRSVVVGASARRRAPSTRLQALCSSCAGAAAPDVEPACRTAFRSNSWDAAALPPGEARRLAVPGPGGPGVSDQLGGLTPASPAGDSAQHLPAGGMSSAASRVWGVFRQF